MNRDVLTLCPARLEPIFSPRPWGAQSLAPFFPEMSDLAEPFGEAWMTGSESRFANGPFAKQKLADAWPAMRAEWIGTEIPRDPLFPLLVKFIFAEEKLSVQVHPDDDFAEKHEKAAGGRGKTEMWYALRARPGAEVLVGLKPGVTREAFQRTVAEGTAENCLQHVPMRSGDAVFVPAGTVHTIGPGLVLCEIQEHSDITYRVHDYNRRDAQGRARPLHVEKALASMLFGSQIGGRIDPVTITRGAITKAFLLACRYFATEKWEFSERISAETSREHFDLLIALEGSGEIRYRGGCAAYAPAQVWMMPAALGAYELFPSAAVRTSLLRTFVPGDLGRFSQALADEGLEETERSRVVRR